MTPEMETILAYVVSLLPSLAAIISIIIAVIKTVSSNKIIRSELATKFDSATEVQKCSISELRKQLKDLGMKLDEVVRENLTLKKSLNECMEVITKIKKEK